METSFQWKEVRKLCGCGGSKFDWDAFEKEEEEEKETDEEAIDVTEEFAIPVRIGEEAEVEAA